MAIILIAGASAAAIFHGQGQKRPDANGSEKPTIIHDGQLTERQRQHSKLFRHSGARFQDLARRQSGDIEVEVGIGLTTSQSERSRLPIFESAVCNADAVIVGTITGKVSQLTEEQNFVFTDYDVSVEEVIKNNTQAPLQANSSITSTRGGGTIEWNGRVFRVRREDFDTPAIGQRYIMFLRFIPATGAYLMYGDGTFQISDQTITALGPTARNEMAKNLSDPTSFRDQIRTFAKSNCRNQ